MRYAPLAQEWIAQQVFRGIFVEIQRSPLLLFPTCSGSLCQT